MPKITKKSFLSGVVSPLLNPEMETVKHAEGLYRCENYMPDLLGGIKNCPGLQYIAAAYDTTIKSRFHSFIFNEEQGYVLEFSNLKMRILKDGGLVGGPTEVGILFVTADLELLEFAQSADVLYVFSGTKRINRITRTSDTVWTVSNSVLNGPYRVREPGDEDITISVSSSFGTLKTLTASAAVFGDVEAGDCFRIGLPVPGDTAAIYWRWFVADAPSSSTTMTATLRSDPLATADADRLPYEHVLNPEFKNGLAAWNEHSTLLSYVGYNSITNVAELNHLATGAAIMQQPVITFANTRQRIEFTVSAMTGGGAEQVLVSVGTTSLGVDIMAAVTITAPGTYHFHIVPTTGLSYVSFDTTGSTSGDVISISAVSLSYDDDGDANIYSSNDWGKGEWNATRGYPKYGIVDGQRLICANHTANPQNIWASELGDYDSFAEHTPSRSTDGFSFFPSTETVNGIKWIIEKGGLKVGTADAVWRIFAPSGGVIAPADIKLEVDEAEGSLGLRPIVAHNAILLTPRGSTPVLEMVSSLEAKGFQSKDLGSDAEHLFKNRRIVRWGFAKDPDSVVWCVLDDGTLLGMVYHRRKDVWAWFERTCPLGAGYADVAVIPNTSDDNTDDVYFLINRGTVQAPNYLIELLNLRITPQEAAYGLTSSGTPYDYKFLDSALTLDAPKVISGATAANPVVITATSHGFLDGDFVRLQNVVGMVELNNNVYKVANKSTHTFELNDSSDANIDGTGFTAYVSDGEARKMVTTVSGLDHLEGEVVTALADGAAREGLTVVSGDITLPISASFVHVGIPYTSEAETLDLEVLFQSGTSQGRLKSIDEVDIYFNESRDLKVYTSNRTDKEQLVEFEDEAFGEEPPPLYDGIKTLDIKSETGKQVRLIFKQDKPYPSHIKRAIIDVDVTG